MPITKTVIIETEFKTLENIDTYSVLRFFNRLKEPGCKSLILLNLKSLEAKK